MTLMQKKEEEEEKQTESVCRTEIEIETETETETEKEFNLQFKGLMMFLAATTIFGLSIAFFGVYSVNPDVQGIPAALINLPVVIFIMMLGPVAYRLGSGKFIYSKG